MVDTFHFHELFGEGKYKEAIKYLEDEVLSFDPNHQDSLLNISYAYDALGEREKAIETCKKLIEINPNNASAFSNLSALHKKSGKLLEAREAAQKSFDIEPSYFNCLNLADILMQSREFEPALKFSQKMLEFKIQGHPKLLFTAYMFIGHSYRKLGELEKAIEFYEKSINPVYNKKEIKRGMKVMFYQQVEVGKFYQLVLYNLAKCSFHLGRTEQANHYCERGLSTASSEYSERISKLKQKIMEKKSDYL